MKRIGFLILLVILIECKQKTNADLGGGTLNSENLVVSANDFSVKMSLKNDSIYNVTEKYIIKEKGYSPQEAEEWIQYMINNELLPPPVLFYYKEPGVVETKTVSYVEFKKYMEIIKDSLDNQ